MMMIANDCQELDSLRGWLVCIRLTSEFRERAAADEPHGDPLKRSPFSARPSVYEFNASDTGENINSDRRYSDLKNHVGSYEILGRAIPKESPEPRERGENLRAVIWCWINPGVESFVKRGSVYAITT